jgi:hypothetical protein
MIEIRIKLTLLPFEFVAKNGIGLGLGGIIRRKVSSRFCWT